MNLQHASSTYKTRIGYFLRNIQAYDNFFVFQSLLNTLILALNPSIGLHFSIHNKHECVEVATNILGLLEQLMHW